MSRLTSFYEQRYSAKAQGTLRRSVAFRAAEHLRIERELLRSHLMSVGFPIVDVGSGGALYLSGDRRLVALDLSHAALERSSRTLRVAASGDALPLPDACADGLICSQTLEHIPDWGRALAEFTRVLRRDGYLILTVPNRYALMKGRYHRLERKIDESGHIHEFRESQLRFALVTLGFEVLRSEGACFDVFWLLAAAERSRAAEWLIPVIDSLVNPAVLSRVMQAEARLRRRYLTGLSLEVVARRV